MERRMMFIHEIAAKCLGFMLILLVTQSSILHVTGHEGHDSSQPHCEADLNPIHVEVPYVPGTVTVDGKEDDWSSIDGQDFLLLKAVGLPTDGTYPEGNGQMSVKVVHDGRDVFFLLKAPGPFVYNEQNVHLSASAALMFGIGNDATLHNMGGCPNLRGSCTAQNCQGHEVDLVQLQISSAIPGRLYGSNRSNLIRGTGEDSVGHLNDLYAYNPHCQFFDSDDVANGTEGTAQNDWKGSWSHSTIVNNYGFTKSSSPYGLVGEDGDFVFEFSRPLRTNDIMQQDVQFTIGGTHRFGIAFWYPINGQEWSPTQHYIISCGWVFLDLLHAPKPSNGWIGASNDGLSNTAAAAISTLSLLIALSAIFVSIVVGWWVRANARSFVGIGDAPI